MQSCLEKAHITAGQPEVLVFYEYVTVTQTVMDARIVRLRVDDLFDVFLITVTTTGSYLLVDAVIAVIIIIDLLPGAVTGRVRYISRLELEKAKIAV